MKVLHLNSFDYGGGAAIATYRLYKELQKIGVHSTLLVSTKITDDDTVCLPGKRQWSKLRHLIRSNTERLILDFYGKRERGYFSPALFGEKNILKYLYTYDIVSLYWVCNGYLTPKIISKIDKPVVWRLSDMWPFTGGCHYSGQCIKYQTTCYNCPMLKKNKNLDLSKLLFNRKTKFLRDKKFVVACPSAWISACAKKSYLFKNQDIRVIETGIDHNIFKPIDKTVARSLLNLPSNKHLILFGAMSATSNIRKGYRYLISALRLLPSLTSNYVEVVLFGSSTYKDTSIAGLKVNNLGRLHDDVTIALAYSASDVFVAPSLEDNLPNTVLESLSCGTPVVAFDIGGLADAIDHLKNGYLATPFNSNDLANGMSWVISNKNRWKRLSMNARQKVEKTFTIEIQAKRYKKLYEEILNKF